MKRSSSTLRSLSVRHLSRRSLNHSYRNQVHYYTVVVVAVAVVVHRAQDKRKSL